MEKLVFDASALLKFGKKGSLGFLLERLGESHSLLTTREVEREILRLDKATQHRTVLKQHFRLQDGKNPKIQIQHIRRLAAVLGSAEISVILLASELNAKIVVDDRTARKEAVALKLKVTGTLALMDDGIKRKWCTDGQCMEIVGHLHRDGFKLPLPAVDVTFAEYFASC